jgi:hypothetical protein
MQCHLASCGFLFAKEEKLGTVKSVAITTKLAQSNIRSAFGTTPLSKLCRARSGVCAPRGRSKVYTVSAEASGQGWAGSPASICTVVC